ncbi:MAG: adenylate/guanylate cyclase domain-containing protein, partial [Rhodopila sp.]
MRLSFPGVATVSGPSAQLQVSVTLYQDLPLPGPDSVKLYGAGPAVIGDIDGRGRVVERTRAGLMLLVSFLRRGARSCRPLAVRAKYFSARVEDAGNQMGPVIERCHVRQNPSVAQKATQGGRPVTRSDGAAKPNGDRDALGATLSALGLGQYAEAFASADINLDILPLLTEDDLKELGLSLGHRRKLLAAVASGGLMIQAASSAPAPAAYQPSGDQGGLLRQVTVLYCDLVGSTELTQSVEPEVMGGILRLFKDTVARAITDFDGYIDHFMGDGVLAFFGYPSAYEDAAERAVRAGLAMLAGVAKIPVPRPDKLAARVAVASGTVFFGEILQHGGAREPIVSGEVTNLVSRMQTVAPVNSLVVSASTRRLLRELFHLTDLGVFEFKGISRPVQAWRVDRERAGGTRFEVSHGAKALPIAGREAEIGL